MPQRLRWVVPFCVAVVLTLFAAPDGSATTSADCDAQVNDTPSKLIPCIQQKDLWKHMQKLQAIADANPSPADGMPSRNSGEPGYKASVDYVAAVMKAAGYDVTIQPYKFTYYAYTATPVFSEVSPTPHDYTAGVEWNPGQSTGTANAALQPAGGIVIPPTETPSSASGCTMADFSGFVPGRIALIQRGTCFFGEKVLNAQSAGATGVVIFNEGNPDRTELFGGSLVDAAGNPIVPTIPVAFTSFDTGLALYQQSIQLGAALPVMKLDIQALVQPNADDWNVIAESKGGDKNHVVVVDAHLDAIYGAGMLDNASGSATILDIAQQLKNTNTRNKLRFIWFGGEELGLLGSDYYVNNLPADELAKIKFDLDADVTATPNYVAGVLDPKDGVTLFGRTPGTPMPPSIWAPSAIARDYGIDYLNSIGKNNILFSADGTDAFMFQQAGIPASGVLTGQDCCKLASDVALFGGYEGNFEGTVPGDDGGCVDNPFRWCDNLSNNDPEVLTWMSKTFANMVGHMAYDTQVFNSTKNGGGHIKKDVTRPKVASPNGVVTS